MKIVYTAFAALVLASAFLIGMSTEEKLHFGDYDNGWQDGYSAAEVSNQLATQRVIAGGLCHYATVACKGYSK